MKDTRNRKMLESYLRTFPNGVFRSLANLRLEEMGEVPPADPALTGKGANELARRVQEELGRVGCSSGKSDGRWGPRSRDALRRFRAAAGMSVAALEPTPDILDALGRHKERVCAPVAKPPRAAKPASKARRDEKPTTRAAVKQPVAKQQASTKAATRAPTQTCREETRDECRVHARAVGAVRHSGFCRQRKMICS